MARYIDADEMIDSVCGMCDGLCESFDTEKCRNCRRDGRCEWRKSLDEEKTIEARPVVRGEWIDGFFKDTVECSVCFEKGVCKCYETRHNFCPNCGADMRGAAMEDEKNEAVSEA